MCYGKESCSWREGELIGLFPWEEEAGGICLSHENEIVIGFLKAFFSPLSFVNITGTQELKNGCHINNTVLRLTKYDIFSGSVSPQ